ncbi:hypothetical protein ACFOW4_07310 [Micromonospora sp. GCM10011542]|uniref:hypothetical protein n=1 Tax=Micromonospora sp. GCM10011542 TaxID=3317337 RepID=UPI00360F6635
MRPPGPRSRRLLAAGLLTGLLLSGCGQDSDRPAVTTAPTTSTAPATAPATTSPSGAPTSAATPPVDRDIVVTVTRKRVDPPTGRVEVGKGQLVRITVTSDVADELHVHGYELGARLPAGEPGTVEFRADRTGLFEVETHETELVLFQLVVR